MAEAIRISQFREFDSKRLVSKLLHDSEKCRVVLFCLEAGQEVLPHETTSEVVFYGVEGKSSILIGRERVELGPEAVAVCPPHQPHGIKATQKSTVLAIITPRPG
ncbi:MAG: cupin domain-containing protein [Chloroflexota bacterium]|nr:cupin domain-containing protein [Chloroflexota bacterium]